MNHEFSVFDKTRFHSIISWLFFILVIATLYLVTGYSGLFFAIPTGYATPIWIPSGIALGATLIWGLRTLPGVFLGSFVTNYLITLRFDLVSPAYIPILIGILIGVGAALQTYVGWWLIKKWIGLHNPLILPNHILLFAFISGPVSCLVNTTWSNSILLMLDMMPATNYPLSWVTWWIGDSIGVLIFTPMFLIMFAQPKELWRQRMLFILLPLCITFAGSSLLYYIMYSIELRRIQASFEKRAGYDLLEIEKHIANFVKSKSTNLLFESSTINQFFPDNINYYSIYAKTVSDINNQSYTYTAINPSLKPASQKYYFKYTYNFQLKTYQWKITLTASSYYINNHFSWRIWFLMVTSLLFCVLINIILFIINGQKMLAQAETEKKSTELEISEAKNLLILKSAGEGIYGLDCAGQLTFINPAAEKMLGYNENEIVGKSMHEILHHSFPDGTVYPKEQCPIYLAFQLNKIFHITDEVFWRKDNSYFWVEYISSPIKEGQRISGAVVVFSDMTQRRMIETQLQKMAFYDTLTMLPNRAGFIGHLSQAILRAQMGKRMLAVCFLDVDNFKQINDNLGHTIGDEILIALAKIIKPALHKHDFIARLGGDEFAIVMERTPSEEPIKTTINRLIHATNKTVTIFDFEIHISISIGIAVYPYAGVETEELVKNADVAMYQAKESGKGRYAFYDENTNRKSKRRHQLDTQMRHALERNEFSLVYQLQYDIHTLKPVGCEALLRWHNPQFGHLEPHEFIMIAEANGMIHKLGTWVLEKSCSEFAKLINAVDKKLVLSVNISVLQLDNPDFIKMIKKTLHDTQMKEDSLVLEITETALIANPAYTVNLMSYIRKLGVRFALDDFGISYSSMKYLKSLPVSFLKIDKSFVKGINASKTDAEIVNAIIQLAHGVGLQIIAEGVESDDQLKLLKKMGCEYVQGYFFAKPMPVEELLKHLLLPP